MKHLFYIHSYITYLVSLQIIKQDCLNPEDCIFIYGRGFKPSFLDSPIKLAEIPFTQHPINSFAVEINFWRGWGKLHRFNSFLKKLLGHNTYHLYTHQTSMDFMRMFMSHRQCLSYNLIEEGVVSYLKISTVNEVIRPVGSSTWRYDVLKWLNFFGKLSFPIRFFSPGYRKVYGLSSFSFPEYARRVELPSPFVNSTESVQYRHVLALDASAENGLTTCESIRFALEKSIEWLIQENVDELWVKYHPEQLINAAVYSFYKEIFSSYTNRITIKEMPQQVCLELIAGNQKLKELTFYVFISSVGIYASMCDRKVYSFANFIVEVDENYTKTLNNLPKVFRESVKFIQAAGEEA